MKNYKFPAFLATILLPVLFIVLLSFTGYGEILNRKLSDLLISTVSPHHTFSKDVVIVDIDETTLALYKEDPEFGRWPWKRSVYPSILSYIEMGNPELILFDIMFTERSPEDASLVQLNETYPNISHAINMRMDESKKVPGEIEISKAISILPTEKLNFPKYRSMSLPAGDIGSTSPFIHVVNIIPDRDGVIRRFSPFVKTENYYYPTLSYTAISNSDGFAFNLSPESLIIKTKEKEYSAPLSGDGFIRAYFYSNSELNNIPRFSVSGILDSLQKIQSGEVDDPSKLLVPFDIFQKKIVLIGTSAAATHDDVVTPFGYFPGVIAQAVFASNMREGHFLSELSPNYGSLSVVLIIILSSYLLFYYEGHWVRLVLPIYVPILFIGIFYTLYSRDLIFPIAPFMFGFPISYILGFSYLVYTEGKDKRKYNSILRNLVDPSVVSHALEDIEALREGGEWEITAFFSDVAGFSSISEELTPKQLAQLLNDYLSAMTEILKHHQGTLDKYIGDAIVGIFGAPLKTTTYASDACTASLKMVKRLEELRAVWNENNSYTPEARKMTFRIGLNCGVAKVGFMGTDSLASYTMMGDMVNLASRLEAAAKDYGTKILVSETIYNVCKDKFHFRYMDKIRVKGKEQPVEIYSLESFLEERIPSEVEGAQIYYESFQVYLSKNFTEAIRGFEKAEKVFNRKDKASRMLIERCQSLLENPPPEGWDGVYTRTVK